MKSIFKISIIVVLLLGFASPRLLQAHCQVPCGIYDDELRIKLIAEHITTIEKAMKQIMELSKGTSPNYNQIVRWVTNKEKHAEEIDRTVTYYFMTQRIKSAPKTDAHKYGHYRERLELLHHLLFYSMKAKQSTDLKVIKNLKYTLEKFKKSYFHKD